MKLHLIAIFTLFTFLPITGFSADNSNHAPSEKMFLQTQDVDGYKVTFHVMKAQPGKEMGGSHDFMVKIEKGGRLVSDVQINSKAIHPDGRSESKMTMKMGDWYMAGYDLGHAGRHQLMILFKTPDGQKHTAGVFYPKE